MNREQLHEINVLVTRTDNIRKLLKCGLINLVGVINDTEGHVKEEAACFFPNDYLRPFLIEQLNLAGTRLAELGFKED